MFDNQVIAITGGTGSFGRAFIRKLLHSYSPKKVIVFSRDELKQYEMEREFTASTMRFFIGDVRDRRRLVQAFDKVDYVVHAAALKHIRAAEYNPSECIKTNIYGAENVISAAIECGVKKVIALSTDKAANPINLYGATKLASDKLFVAGNNMVGQRETRLSVVRYGNVIGSRGSVVPFFRKIIKQGATELPITDERMTRFWITPSEGADFVVKSFFRMHGGEIFIPRIPSARIVDLAMAMSPNAKLRVVGIGPGEKLHEILCPADDSTRTIQFTDHFVICPSITFHAHPEYTENAIGERGSPVAAGFEYKSETNSHFLSVKELSELVASEL